MVDVIYDLVIVLFGWFLALGGIVLNYAINTFVIGFGTQFENSGIGFVVNQSWATLRDIFNLVFIFGLVAIGFKMILRVNDSNSKRWLVMLILAALLVNFSLFITKFIVDFSNIVAVEMINEGMRTETFNGYVFRPNEDGANGVNVSGSMKDILQVNTVFSQNSRLLDPVTKTWGLVFGTMIIYIVAGFVFISAGIMLIIRAAVLIVLMIVSPFLFIGMVFPSLQSSASKLWKMLFTRAFFAPIYITFLYITLKVSGDFMSAMTQQSSTAPNMVAALTANGNLDSSSTTVANTFGPFIIITALFMISLVAAQKIGAEGGTTAIKMGKSAMGYGRKKVVGGAAGIGLRQVARGAEVARNRYDRLDRTAGGRGIRTAAAVLSLGALSNNNVRGALNATTKASFSGSETLEQRRKRNIDTTKGRSDQARIVENKKTMSEIEETFESTATTADELNTAMDDLTKVTKSMSEQEKNDLAQRVTKLQKKGDVKSTELAETYAMRFSEKDIEAFEKTGEFSHEQISVLKKTRGDAFKSTAAKGSTISSRPSASHADFTTVQRSNMFTKQSTKDAGKHPVDVYTEDKMAEHITPQALVERMLNGDVSNDNLGTIGTNIQKLIDRDPVALNRWQEWSKTSQGRLPAAQLGLVFPVSTTSSGPTSGGTAKPTASERTRERAEKTKERRSYR